MPPVIVPLKALMSAPEKSPPASVPLPVIASLNVPPVMVPLHVTSTVTALFPALKEAPESMTILLTLPSPMVSGASASSSASRSTVPVMVSVPSLRLKFLNTPPETAPSSSLVTSAPLKSPPVMVPLLVTVPVNVPSLISWLLVTFTSVNVPPLIVSLLVTVAPVKLPSLMKPLLVTFASVNVLPSMVPLLVTVSPVKLPLVMVHLLLLISTVALNVPPLITGSPSLQNTVPSNVPPLIAPPLSFTCELNVPSTIVPVFVTMLWNVPFSMVPVALLVTSKKLPSLMVPLLVTAALSTYVPPLMVPLLVTGTDTASSPALKVAPSAMVMLLMLSWFRAMVSGASEPPLLRSILPVMVSSPVAWSKAILLNVPPVTVPPDRFSTVASVKSPPVMEPVLFTVPVISPPVILPIASKWATFPSIFTFAEPVISP